VKRPNILYLHAHDTGRWVQPYGYAVPTPHLQRLAEEGVLFRQAFCAAPTCSPSRAALLTGQWAHRTGMLGLAHRGFALNDCRQHLVHTLRQHGYLTALAGIQHEAATDDAIGYDRVLASKFRSRRADDFTRAACDFLAGAPGPFFLSVGYAETHRPFPPVDAPGPDQDRAGFAASVGVLDRHIGVVLNAVNPDNTLIICTTDHGPAFPGMKCNLTDHGLGVMLIMRGPGGFAGGKVIDAMISQIDIFPTLCELLEIERPAWLQGRSMFPLLRGTAPSVREELFGEVNYHAAYEPQRCIRTPHWKYIRRFDDRARAVLPNVDPGPSKSFWMEHGWPALPHPPEMLFDLELDPNETNNLVAAPHAQPALADLRARLERWMRETDDPLLRGPVPAPPGSQVTDPDAIDP